ncbi:MAG: glycosylhydrolase-like jelly roll fold domain-containing protein, partial [Acidobacteriota bacterium]
MDSGERTPALIYRESGDQTSIPVRIAAHGSIFVVFQHPSGIHAVEASHDGHPLFPSVESGAGTYASSHKVFATEPGDYQLKLSNGKQQTIHIATSTSQPTLAGPWTLSFPANWGAPASINVDKLQSWTDSTIPGVRYFSGTGTYANSINVPADLLAGHRAIWLNLGDAREVVTVAINGKDLRTLWHGPYIVRIDPALHPGTNSLSIRVTNLWPNRIIGDKQPSEQVHYTHTNAEHYTKDSPLLPSGLLTPVTFEVFEGHPVQ